MALSATDLATDIKAKLLADPNSMAVDNAALTALCKAVAEATVDHIVDNAVIPAGAATTCPAGAGTVSAPQSIT